MAHKNHYRFAQGLNDDVTLDQKTLRDKRILILLFITMIRGYGEVFFRSLSDFFNVHEEED